MPRSTGSSFNDCEDDRLHEDALKTRLRKRFNVNYEHITKAFRVADVTQKGVIHLCVLRNILEVFCFPFSDDQWKEIISDFTCPAAEFDYNLFVEFYRRNPEENKDRWIQKLGDVIASKPKYDDPVKYSEYIRHIKDVSKGKRNSLLKEFLKCDPDRTGSISKEAFYHVISRQILRMSSCHFEQFWSEVPKDAHGNVRYVEFLQQYGCWHPDICTPDVKVSPHETKTKNLDQQDGTYVRVEPELRINCKVCPNLKPECKLPRQFDKCYINRVLGQPHMDACYVILKRYVKCYWRDIMRFCLALDKLKKGSLTGNDFRAILLRVGVPLNKDQMLNYLACEHGVCPGSAVDYWHFLKKFLLIKNIDTNTAYTAFHKMQQMRKKEDPNQKYAPTKSLERILHLRRPVLQNWTSLLYCFRKCDRLLDGILECCTFDNILRGHGIQLREEQMFDLMECLDPNLSGNVCYLDFMRYFSNDIYD